MKKNLTKTEVSRKIIAEIAKCKMNIHKICMDSGMSYQHDLPEDAAENIMFNFEFFPSELYRFKPTIFGNENPKELNKYLEKCRKGGWKENSK